MKKQDTVFKNHKSRYNWTPNFEKGDSTDIKTIQDDSFTIRQIIERTKLGHDLNMLRNDGIGFAENNPNFDSPDYQEIQRMDLFEKTELLEDINQTVKNLQKSISDQVAEQKAAAQKSEPPLEGTE